MPSFPLFVPPMSGFGAPSTLAFLSTPLWTPTLFWVVVAEVLWVIACCVVLWLLRLSRGRREPEGAPPKRMRVPARLTRAPSRVGHAVS